MNPLLDVMIAEKGGKILQKVKVSGGGRCNVTHACFDIREMSRRYPRGERFVRKAFYHFFTSDTIQWFQERGVPLKQEEDGRMFPEADTSQAIVDCLTSEMNIYGVRLALHTAILKIQPQQEGFNIMLGGGQSLYADFVVVATGGFSRLDQLDWLKNLNLTMETPVPSLFTFNFPGHPLNQLMGVVAPECSISIAGTRFCAEGPVLITHWGLSGPAILRLSAFAARELAQRNYQFTVVVNWCCTYNEQTFTEKIRHERSAVPSRKVINGNFTGLASRLWEHLLNISGIDNNRRWADLTVSMMNKLSRNCCAYVMTASGKTTFKEEFVSAGGISLTEIEPDTMMSKKYPGLYFAGEVMDVDGITGGYNFQHAWTSGYIAACHISSRS